MSVRQKIERTCCSLASGTAVKRRKLNTRYLFRRTNQAEALESESSLRTTPWNVVQPGFNQEPGLL